MLRTFNCGVGGILIASAENAPHVASVVNANIIGEVKSRKKGNRFLQKL